MGFSLGNIEIPIVTAACGRLTLCWETLNGSSWPKQILWSLSWQNLCLCAIECTNWVGVDIPVMHDAVHHTAPDANYWIYKHIVGLCMFSIPLAISSVHTAHLRLTVALFVFGPI